MKFLSFVLFLISFKAIAGYEVGNGGDGLYCPHLDTEKIVSYDYYEAKKRGLELQLGENNLSLEAKVEIAIRRLSGHSQKRTSKYLDWLSSFFEEAEFLKYGHLFNIRDGFIFDNLPKGCRLVQLAYQVKPLNPEDKRYIINELYWRDLNLDQKAILILHEILYRDAIENDISHSVGVRYFNSLLFSGEILDFDRDAYRDLIVELNLFENDEIKFINYGRAEFRTWRKQTHYESGALISGTIVRGYVDFEINGISYRVGAGIDVIFGSDGSVLEVSGILGNFFENIEINGRKINIIAGIIRIRKRKLYGHKKNIIVISQLSNEILKLRDRNVIDVQGYKLIVDAKNKDEFLTFHENGSLNNIQRFFVNEEALVHLKDGSQIKLFPGEFYEAWFNDQEEFLKIVKR